MNAQPTTGHGATAAEVARQARSRGRVNVRDGHVKLVRRIRRATLKSERFLVLSRLQAMMGTVDRFALMLMELEARSRSTVAMGELMAESAGCSEATDADHAKPERDSATDLGEPGRPAQHQDGESTTRATAHTYEVSL